MLHSNNNIVNPLRSNFYILQYVLTEKRGIIAGLYAL